MSKRNKPKNRNNPRVKKSKHQKFLEDYNLYNGQDIGEILITEIKKELKVAFTITKTITKCRECPHYTNSSIEHDDAFTSAPYPIIEYCKKLKDSYSSIIQDSSQIHSYCPLNKGT